VFPPREIFFVAPADPCGGKRGPPRSTQSAFRIGRAPPIGYSLQRTENGTSPVLSEHCRLKTGRDQTRVFDSRSGRFPPPPERVTCTVGVHVNLRARVVVRFFVISAWQVVRRRFEQTNSRGTHWQRTHQKLSDHDGSLLNTFGPAWRASLDADRERKAQEFPRRPPASMPAGENDGLSRCSWVAVFLGTWSGHGRPSPGGPGQGPLKMKLKHLKAPAR